MRINRKAIGQRIAQQRGALDLTQAKLAEDAHLETLYISQLERGARLASVDALYRIANVLKVTPGFLLDGKEPVAVDPLTREIQALVTKWPEKQRKAVLKAFRVLAELIDV